jgi:flavodoxin
VVARVIVVYESKYGNTKRAAEEIVEGLRSVEGTEPALRERKDVVPNDLTD